MRPEYVRAFQNEGMRAVNANKSVIAGIGEVGKLLKTNRLFILSSAVNRFDDEIYMYVWNERTGEPISKFDDVLDSLRYAIYSNSMNQGIKLLDRNLLF